MQAKLIRTIPAPADRAWYFTRYEYECIKCGEHYFRGQCSNRITPYCVDCHREIEKQKYKENVERKRRMQQEAMENFCDHYCKYPDTWDEEKEGVPLSDSDICAKCPLGKLEKVPAVKQEPERPAEDWSRVRVKEYRQGQINILKIIEANVQNEIKRIREELQGLKESEGQE